MINRYLQRNPDGSLLLVEGERSTAIPAGTAHDKVVATMLAFYTPVPPEDEDGET